MTTQEFYEIFNQLTNLPEDIFTNTCKVTSVYHPDGIFYNIEEMSQFMEKLDELDLRDKLYSTLGKYN